MFGFVYPVHIKWVQKGYQLDVQTTDNNISQIIVKLINFVYFYLIRVCPWNNFDHPAFSLIIIVDHKMFKALSCKYEHYSN